jgi:hypothetical protein
VNAVSVRWWARLAAVVAIGLLAGCSGASTPTIPEASAPPTSSSGSGASPASASTSAAVGVGAEVAAYVRAQRAWVACIRQHGFDLPDPDPHGIVDLSSFPKNEPAARSAWLKCQHLSVAMPDSVQQYVMPPLTAAQKAVKRRYATCMQANGAPDFPDPGPDGYFLDRSWDETSAGAQHASTVCAHIIGAPATPGAGVG